VLCAIIAAAAVAIPASLRAQLTVDELELFMRAGGVDGTRTFQVRNDGDRPMQAEISIEDWDRAPDGQNRFYAAGSNPSSCASRLSVFPTALRLEPGQLGTVRVALAPDSSGASAPCWSIVFIANPASMQQGGRQLLYTMRTGVKVYGEPVSPRRDGAIVDMALDAGDGLATGATPDRGTGGPSADPARALGVTFRNLGDVQLRVQGAVEVRRFDNTLVERLPFDAFPVLPAADRRVRVAVPSLPAGRYLLLALLDFGGDEITAGQLEYEVR
jgi:hypothetical protein